MSSQGGWRRQDEAAAGQARQAVYEAWRVRSDTKQMLTIRPGAAYSVVVASLLGGTVLGLCLPLGFALPHRLYAVALIPFLAHPFLLQRFRKRTMVVFESNGDIINHYAWRGPATIPSKNIIRIRSGMDLGGGGLPTLLQLEVQHTEGERVVKTSLSSVVRYTPSGRAPVAEQVSDWAREHGVVADLRDWERW